MCVCVCVFLYVCLYIYLRTYYKSKNVPYIHCLTFNHESID